MRTIICENYEEMSRIGAKLVASQISLKPESVLGFATGSTPVGVYTKLIEMYKAGELDFSSCVGFNLDEYYPIKKENPQSYFYFMRDKLFAHINMKATYIPNGEAEDAPKACADYDTLIDAHGGVDLQILGIGHNGHIGFNEPDTALVAGTHVTGLTESTINANARFFDSADEVPKKAMTMGMATILKAKKIVLFASGADKHNAVKGLLDDAITTQNPATLLKLHGDVVLVLDKDAYNG